MPQASGVALSGTLPPVALRRRTELNDFERMVHGVCGSSLFPRRQDLARWGRSPLLREAASLALDLIDSGALPSVLAARLVTRANDEEYGGLACDLLRIAAELLPRRAAGVTDYRWVDTLRRAVAGFHAGARPEGPAGAPLITSAGDLAAYAVAAEAIALCRSDLVEESNVTVPEGTVRILKLRNRHLEQLILQRPTDGARILAYIKERPISPHHTTDVDHLRAMLDEAPPALGEGWL